MDEQYKKLIDMLSSMVAKLDRLEGYEQKITDLAKRHEGYGVQPIHYEMVGEALLWTLEKGLGDDWNEETATAWLTCYELVSKKMTNK